MLKVLIITLILSPLAKANDPDMEFLQESIDKIEVYVPQEVLSKVQASQTSYSDDQEIEGLLSETNQENIEDTISLKAAAPIRNKEVQSPQETPVPSFRSKSPFRRLKRSR